MQLSIAIRTITVARGVASLHAGGGITALSEPEAEYQETLDKAAALIAALEGGRMILLLDHDDSFVFTLARYVEELGEAPVVLRTQGVTLDVIRAMAPTRIILSPGPGTPEACTLALDVVRTLGATTPILGVCLGHQVIATAYGATVARAAHPRHGRTSPITHDGVGVFAELPSPLEATRYHSLAVVEATLPPELMLTARADDGEVMGSGTAPIRWRGCSSIRSRC
jgi:anthranilate synthase/aminodeoxychorismate synthase-like glutamine amidotransferase